jgi:chemotaxis protein CheX
MAFKTETLSALNTTEERLVKVLTQDVQEIFSSMVGVEDILYLPPQVEMDGHFKECLTAMVGLAGSYSGLVSIHVPWPLALAFTSQMLGMEVTEIDDDVTDAMGEIANMIAGSFKQHLSKGGGDIQLSTPSVVTGADYTISNGSTNENITLKLATDEEWFMVSLTLED